MLLPCNLYTHNGGRKVTTANLQTFYLQTSYETFYHIVFLEVCQSYEITPIGSHIKKITYVGKPSKNFLLLWEKELGACSI